MSTFNNNSGGTLGPDSVPEENTPPKFSTKDSQRLRAKRKDLKPPKFTPRN